MTDQAVESKSIAKTIEKFPAKAFWTVIVVVVLGAGLFSISVSSEQTDAQRAKAVSQQLRCLECEGLSVYDSDTKTSKTITKDVARRVKAGQSDGEIFSYYESVYGEYIRLAPTTDSGNWLIYVAPAFFVIAFCVSLFLSIRKNVTSRTLLLFWSATAIIFVIGIAVFVNDSKSTSKQARKAQQKSTEELLQESVDESPSNSNLRRLAKTQFVQEDFVNALKNFDEAARLDPKDAESKGYGAYIVFLSGQDELAAQRANDAVNSNPDNPAARFFRGIIYLQTETSDEAVKASNQAIANADFDVVLKVAPDSEFATQIEKLRSNN